MSSFEEYLNENSPRVDAYIDEYYPQGCHPDMDRYLLDFLKAFTDNGGKRHRPLICELACMAVGGQREDVQSAAAALEHFHSSALIHDDIADESLLRRGEPCLYVTQGVGLAINAGDLALSLLTGAVVMDPSYSDAVKIRILQEFNEMAFRTIQGQALDVGWARDGRFDITVEDYLVMATHKTAFYSGGIPLAVGAIIGGGTEEQIETLRSFGMATGLAFQIQDDLLNLVGDAELVGKDYRSDITEGKRTLSVVHALQDSPDSGELAAILASHTDDPAQLQRAVDIMVQAGSLDFARAYAMELVDNVTNDLRQVLEPSESRDLLESMAEYFVNRMH